MKYVYLFFSYTLAGFSAHAADESAKQELEQDTRGNSCLQLSAKQKKTHIDGAVNTLLLAHRTMEKGASLKELSEFIPVPESTLPEGKTLITLEMEQQRSRFMFGLIGILSLAFLLLATRMGSHLIGRMIEASISELAPHLLGVDVNFEYIHVKPLIGRVHLSKMDVLNPTRDPPYTSACMLHADKVVVDIDMRELIRSSLSTIHFEELVFKGVHITYERPQLLYKRSNVEDLRDHLRSKRCLGNDDMHKDSTDDHTAKVSHGKKRSYIINKLVVEHVGAEAKIEGATLSFTMPAIECTDLSKECAGTDIEDIIVALVEKIAESILTSAEEAVEGAATRTLDLAHNTLKRANTVVESARVSCCSPCLPSTPWTSPRSDSKA